MRTAWLACLASVRRPACTRSLVTLNMEPAAKRARPVDTLGDEMKQYEANTCASVVDVSLPVVVRLDGHCFSTYTKGFDRPYDLRIHDSMVQTSIDLIEHFGAVTAYTESDEISLFFRPHSEEAPSAIPFNGRVQKMVSVFAGYASARFNAHMLKQDFDTTQRQQAALRARVEESAAHFDARVFALPSIDRVVAYARWRAVVDCKRNSVSMLAQAHFSPEELHGVDAATCIAMLRERKGVLWHETPPFFRFGTYVKKEVFHKAGFDRRAQQEVLARRTRPAARAFALVDAEASEFLLARQWPGEGPGSGVVVEGAVATEDGGPSSLE